MAQQAGSDETLYIHFENGLLSLRSESLSLAELLFVIGEEAGFEVSIDRDLDVSINVSMTGLPLQQAFKRLLPNDSYLVFFDARDNVSALRVLEAATDDGEPSLQPSVSSVEEPDAADLVIWILDRLASPSQDDRIVGVRRLAELEGDAAFDLASSVLQTDPLPVVRAEAIAAFAKTGEERVFDLLDAAFIDPDGLVRRRAIQVWQSLGSERGSDAIGRLSNEDPEGETRLQALQALWANGGEAARYYIEQAGSDSDEAVRLFAEQALSQEENSGRGQTDGNPGDDQPEVTQ
jgi:hypothetical protein